MSVEERDPMSPDAPPETAPDRGTEGPSVTPPQPEPRRGLPPVLYPILAGIFGGALVWAYSRILLAVSSHTIKLFGHSTDGKTVAAAIALLVPLNILIGGALVAYGARVRRRPAAFPLLVGAAALVVVAGVVATNIKAPAEAPTVHTVALLAQNIAFQPSTLTLPAGEKVQIKFDNKDAGVQHNFVLFNGGDANAPPLFRGPVVTGPATITYPFTAPPAGTYFFHCEIHPNQMTGTVTVAAPSSGGQPTGGTSGAGGLQLTAKSLAFSSGSLAAPAAGGQITVHFDNEDPQVVHNLVVFDGKDASSPILFRGSPLTGPGSVDYTFAAPPPGTYFYHCEFHPTTMTGTLTVP